MPDYLPASYCAFSGLPGQGTSLQVQWGFVRDPGPLPAELGSPWWSCAGPVTARPEVISVAPPGCTQGELRGEQKRAVTWDSERGRGIEAVFVDKMVWRIISKTTVMRNLGD